MVINMLPRNEKYMIYPAVVAADKACEMTILPTERAYLLFEGEEYSLTLIDVDGDELDYHAPISHKKMTVKAEGGVLRFSYAFPEEGEHIVLLHKNGKKLSELHVYSLYEDLWNLTPLRADFHSHSFRSDGARDPAALAGHFREQGYDLFALTDHNRYYPGGEIDEVYDGLKLGIRRIRGEELHAPGNIGHIVHVFGKESVAEQYWPNLEKYQAEVKEKYLPKVPQDVPEKYKERYAIFMWEIDKVHEVGGIAIFAHPYWCPGGSLVYNVRNELARLYLKSGMFDAYELVGGMRQHGVNLSLALWQELLAEGILIPVVGSSDVHQTEAAYSFPHYFTLLFAENETDDALKKAVLTGNSLAVEATGEEYGRHFRAYGKHRLVMYAQFLFRFFFPAYWRLTQAEGIAMRSYAMEETDAALVEKNAETALDFKARFFGKKAPKLPSKAMLDFEEKWRARHLEGPHTKGSTLLTDEVTRQI